MSLERGKETEDSAQHVMKNLSYIYIAECVTISTSSQDRQKPTFYKQTTLNGKSNSDSWNS